MPDPVRKETAPGAMPGVRLNLGCGRDIRLGWVNIDAADLPGVDVVANFEACRFSPLPFDESSVGEMLLSHTLEHVRDSLGLMQELHRIATPGATLTVRVPYGSSDDAWEDPTHVRPYFLGSWGYFSQPYYWRADYGYRGDWQPSAVTLVVPRDWLGISQAVALDRVRTGRNAVREMIAVLTAIKPIRAPRRELQDPAAPRRWTSRVAGVVNALVIGGVVCGTLMGAVLDIAYRLTRQHGRLRIPPEPGAPSSSGSTDGKPLPK